MSSLGDIVQAFDVLDLLRSTFPNALIDWACEDFLIPLVSAHPYVNETLSVNFKELKKNWRKISLWKKLFRLISRLRRKRYDLLFDLQGNCKSGIVTGLARAREKVGFGIRCVREKPNVLSTHIRFDVSRQMNIREQYLELARQFLKKRLGLERLTFPQTGVALKLEAEERGKVDQIFQHSILQERPRIMVCPGSQWVNKQIPIDTLEQFLQLIREKISGSFLFVWGSDAERKDCERLQLFFKETSVVLEKLSFPALQNVMHEVDVVIAVDSSALHLCSITKTPSFSVFGPTSPNIFKPLGFHHFAFQGVCPYGKKFDKLCPLLRTCSTGACMKNLEAPAMAEAFFLWWANLQRRREERKQLPAVCEAAALPFGLCPKARAHEE